MPKKIKQTLIWHYIMFVPSPIVPVQAIKKTTFVPDDLENDLKMPNQKSAYLEFICFQG
jgi:hypothetical protein